MISDHAVGITLRGSGLKIDVAPVLYDGEDDDRGHLITRQGDRVRTSVTLHLRFTNDRKRAAGRGYAELIRLLKAWIREAKRTDEDLRCNRGQVGRTIPATPALANTSISRGMARSGARWPSPVSNPGWASSAQATRR